MEFKELIKARESVRSYDPQKVVPQEVLLRILEAGRLAPSAANRQPLQFIVVSSKEMLDKVRPCYQRPWFQQAPHILIVKGFRNKAWVRSQDGYNAIETDLTIAMSYITLASADKGIGSYWIAAYDPAVIKRALELKDDEVVFSLTPLGYPGKDYVKSGGKDRKKLEEIAVFI